MSIRKREWTTASGEAKTAWLAEYRDSAGKRRSKQFSRKKEADAYSDQVRTEVRQDLHTHACDSIAVAVSAELWLAAN